MCLVKQYTVKCRLQQSYLIQQVGRAQATAQKNISMPLVPCNSTYDCNLHILILEHSLQNASNEKYIECCRTIQSSTFPSPLLTLTADELHKAHSANIPQHCHLPIGTLPTLSCTGVESFLSCSSLLANLITILRFLP